MSNDPFLVPRGFGESVIVEKRSRFIGAVAPVAGEEAARAFLTERREAHRDARHHVYAYVLRDSGVLRYSDDGEPQGTGGLPVLEVLRREGVFDVCCVVTRYFGGVLLGAPGLTRAYAASAKAALDVAGVAVMRAWISVILSCSYSLWQIMRLEITAAEGIEEMVDFGADVTAELALPSPRLEEFRKRVVEVSAGQAFLMVGAESFRSI